MNNTNLNLLKDQILSAFSNLERPGKNKIGIDGDWEQADINYNFSRKNITDEILEWHRNSLAAFTPEGFVFFLKYYLLYALDHPDSEVTDYLIYRFCTIAESNENGRKQIKYISKDMWLVIADFFYEIKSLLSAEELYLLSIIDKAENFARSNGRMADEL